MNSIRDHSNKKDNLLYDKIDNKNIKIMLEESKVIEDKENTSIEDYPQSDLNSITSISSSKWTQEYTYPADSNLSKFKLKSKIIFIFSIKVKIK